METQETQQEVLGWTRDEKGNIIDRHPVAVANCVTAGPRDNTQNYVKEKAVLHIPQATKEGSIEVPVGGVFDGSYPGSETRRGRVQEGGTVSPTLMAAGGELMHYTGVRIRRLTERELFRLMDVEERDIDTLLSAGIAKTQLAKMAGNSIVVSCLYHIFRNLYIDRGPAEGTQIKLF